MHLSICLSALSLQSLNTCQPMPTVFVYVFLLAHFSTYKYMFLPTYFLILSVRPNTLNLSLKGRLPEGDGTSGGVHAPREVPRCKQAVRG